MSKEIFLIVGVSLLLILWIASIISFIKDRRKVWKKQNAKKSCTGCPFKGLSKKKCVFVQTTLTDGKEKK